MRRANPAVIGGFIVGAVVLVIAGVVILGSGKFFAETITCVMYFEGAIQGLHVGAPINFRGVKVGSVTGIKIQYDHQNLAIRIPVFAEFPKGPRGSIEMRRDSPTTLQEALEDLIRQGLHAQLQTESLVTGQLFVQLDIYPSTYLNGPPTETISDSTTGRLEIPTVPTALQEVSNTARRAIDKLAELPLEEMVLEFEGMLRGINRLVNDPEVFLVIRNMNMTLTEIQQLVRQADQQVKLVGSSATTTLGNLNQLVTQVQQLTQSTQHLMQQIHQQFGHVANNATAAMGNVHKLTQTVDKQTLELTSSLVHMATASINTLEQMRQTLASAQQLITPNAPLGYELVKMLRELSEAARSLRVLTDYLERHPNAVIFGRKEQGAR